MIFCEGATTAFSVRTEYAYLSFVYLAAHFNSTGYVASDDLKQNFRKET